MPPTTKPARRPLELTEVLSLLLQVGERISSTLDLDELLPRIAEIIKTAIDYEVFAILLVSEKAQELRIRFSVGHPEDVVRKLRIKIGEGVVGRAAQLRRSVLVNDVAKDPSYIQSLPAIRSELAVPLIFKNRVVAVMDLESPWPNFFNEQHQNLLELLASRIAVAIENARLYRRSVRQARTLQVLNEISREMTSVLVLSELLRKIGTLIQRLIHYDRFGILLADEQTQTFNTVISVKQNQSLPDKVSVPFGKGIIGAAAAVRQPVLAADVTRDPRYIPTNSETRSELAIPLVHRDRVIGVVDLESGEVGAFNEDHVRIFSTLGPQVAIAIENARLYERAVRSEARMERDLDRAREIQMHMMPTPSPAIPGLEVRAQFRPARELGGDFYDFLAYGKERQVLAIGDVSGKGAPAALYGAMAIGTLRSLARQRLTAPEMLKKLNILLLERKIEGHFITLTYCVWEPRTRVLKLANAGMPLPVLIRKGKVHAIRAEGVPLGLLDQVEYQETSLTLQRGDVLAMFSDGLTEATNIKLEEFGNRRLEALLRDSAHEPPERIVEKLFDAVGKFEQGRPPRDDQTIMVMKAHS